MWFLEANTGANIVDKFSLVVRALVGAEDSQTQGPVGGRSKRLSMPTCGASVHLARMSRRVFRSCCALLCGALFVLYRKSSCCVFGPLCTVEAALGYEGRVARPSCSSF